MDQTLRNSGSWMGARSRFPWVTMSRSIAAHRLPIS